MKTNNLKDLSINGIASFLQLNYKANEIAEETLFEIIDKLLNQIDLGKQHQLSSHSELLYQQEMLQKMQLELDYFLSATNGIDFQIKNHVQAIYLEVISRLSGKQIVVKTPKKQFGNLNARQIAILFNALKELNLINDRKTELGDGLSILFGISSDNIRVRLSYAYDYEENDREACISFMEAWIKRFKDIEPIKKN